MHSFDIFPLGIAKLILAESAGFRKSILQEPIWVSVLGCKFESLLSCLLCYITKVLENQALPSFMQTYLCWPNVNTLIKGATSQIFAIWTEGYTVHWFLMPCERVDTKPPIYIPQPHCGVKWCTEIKDIKNSYNSYEWKWTNINPCKQTLWKLASICELNIQWGKTLKTIYW